MGPGDAPPPGGEDAAPAAGRALLGRRIGAALLDVLLLSLLLSFAQLLAGEGSAGADEDLGEALTGDRALVYAGIGLVYFGLFEALRERTPGKAALGLRVTGLDGSRVTTRQAVVRTLLRIADSFPGFYLVGLVAILVTKRGQRLGDLAAETVVTRDAGGRGR